MQLTYVATSVPTIVLLIYAGKKFGNLDILDSFKFMRF